MLHSIIRFFLSQKLITLLFGLGLLGWGLATAPFDWPLDRLPRDPVPVDAIPDLSENQQIVFTRWPGHSPQDVQDQITYPLTTALLGVPGVEEVRSSSMFGFSSIYVIFEEGVEFYWSRSRILEKLNALPAGLLPEKVQPSLGPDATALGQVFWYTLEGHDPQGRTVGGWDLEELRSLQDYYVRYGLASAKGVAEVASIGGYVREYQIELRPEAMKAFGIGIPEVLKAVQQSNEDAGANTLEINRAEYLVRGLGYLESVEDLENSVIKAVNHRPVRIRDIARVQLGPAERRGVLDKNGAEAVGGVVVARYGANPLEVIQNIKAQIEEIRPGLPTKTLEDGATSQVTIVPFYDRTELIYETLGTLEDALSLQVLITVIVLMVMLVRLRAAVAVSLVMPLGILAVFIAMRYSGVDANIVALSGIAIAIGTMADLGIVLTENVIQRLKQAPEGERREESIYQASAEVSGAIATAVATTIISFVPVFSLQGAEGKLFTPLAFTKTYALAAALIIALVLTPSLLNLLFGWRKPGLRIRALLDGILLLAGIGMFWYSAPMAFVLLALGLSFLAEDRLGDRFPWLGYAPAAVVVLAVSGLLAAYWQPLGIGRSWWSQAGFTLLILSVLLGLLLGVVRVYPRVLRWALVHKALFLSLPMVLLLLALLIWRGWNGLLGWMAHENTPKASSLRQTAFWQSMETAFPGLGKEFMPTLDEGAFLLMPTSMPHSGIRENIDILQYLDRQTAAIQEVEGVLGKLGRVESALDPAPISMFENIIQYKPEYTTDRRGRAQKWTTNERGHFWLRGLFVDAQGRVVDLHRNQASAEGKPLDSVYFDNDAWRFVRGNGKAFSEPLQEALERQLAGDFEAYLVPDPESGRPFRNWRPSIQSKSDIWDAIVSRSQWPGLTSAPRLQPIETRLVMLQTGMRAPMGIKVRGPDLETLDAFSRRLESLLKEVKPVQQEAVFAERVVGKPYLEIDLNREQLGRYGLTISRVQEVIRTAIGGQAATQTVEGRRRYAVRLRYPRELRDHPDALRQVLVQTPEGSHIPLGQLAEIRFRRGPQAIKSEETFLTNYVLFDAREGQASIDVVEAARAHLEEAIASGRLEVPQGVSYRFAGDYENQLRAEKRLSLVVPLVLAVIFLILYLQFRSVWTALMVVSGVAVAFSGGFLMLGLYGQPWFLDVTLFGASLRDLFQIEAVNLSVAVWVGFIALFGIATDDGVLMATYLDQRFRRMPQGHPRTRAEVHRGVIEAATRRVRPAMITTATTLIALLPILTSTGKGANIMVPMAIPAFGGMLIAILTVFIVPVLYAIRMERS